MSLFHSREYALTSESIQSREYGLTSESIIFHSREYGLTSESITSNIGRMHSLVSLLASILGSMH